MEAAGEPGILQVCVDAEEPRVHEPWSAEGTREPRGPYDRRRTRDEDPGLWRGTPLGVNADEGAAGIGVENRVVLPADLYAARCSSVARFSPTKSLRFQ